MIKEIPGYPGYAISETGEVWSSLRRNKRKLQPHKNRYGYLCVTLTSPPRVSKLICVHRLVLLTFKGQPPTSKHEGCHGNGIRTDNRIDNLRWDTRKNNYIDARLHGTRGVGEKTHHKLTSEQVTEILSLLRAGRQQREIAAKYGVDQKTISDINRGKNWGHITGIKYQGIAYKRRRVEIVR